MSDSQTPAGWYQDPSRQAPYRWWDGHSWTPSTTADPTAGQPGPALTPQAPTYAPFERPKLPADRPVRGPFIWTIVLVPIISLVLSLFYRPSYRYTTIDGIRELDPSSIFTPLYIVLVIVGLAIYALTVVLAFRDQRWLMKQGVVRPFAWGWAFLQPVYAIGRSVIVHGVAPGRGALWPMWVFLAIEAASLILGIVHGSSFTGPGAGAN